MHREDTQEQMLYGGVRHTLILSLSLLSLSHSTAPLEIYTSHLTHPLHLTHTLVTLTHENVSSFPVLLAVENREPCRE